MGSRSIPNNSNFQSSSDEESYAHVVVFETTVSDPNRPIRPPTKKSQNDMTTAPIISVGNSHEGFQGHVRSNWSDLKNNDCLRRGMV